MTAKEKINALLSSSDNGVVTVKQILLAGANREAIRDFVEKGDLYCYARGLYVKSDAWEDELYLLQQKYSRGIFSHDAALYLLGFSDRTPSKFTMTFPQGYNAPSLKDENVVVKRAIPEFYGYGIVEVKSPFGNPIHVYNLEKTLCDVVRGNGIDIQIVNDAMKRYASFKNKDIHKFMQYADKLHVKSKVSRYMEVLL